MFLNSWSTITDSVKKKLLEQSEKTDYPKIDTPVDRYAISRVPRENERRLEPDPSFLYQTTRIRRSFAPTLPSFSTGCQKSAGRKSERFTCFGGNSPRKHDSLQKDSGLSRFSHTALRQLQLNYFVGLKQVASFPAWNLIHELEIWSSHHRLIVYELINDKKKGTSTKASKIETVFEKNKQ